MDEPHGGEARSSFPRSSAHANQHSSSKPTDRHVNRANPTVQKAHIPRVSLLACKPLLGARSETTRVLESQFPSCKSDNWSFRKGGFGLAAAVLGVDVYHSSNFQTPDPLSVFVGVLLTKWMVLAGYKEEREREREREESEALPNDEITRSTRHCQRFSTKTTKKDTYATTAGWKHWDGLVASHKITRKQSGSAPTHVILVGFLNRTVLLDLENQEHENHPPVAPPIQICFTRRNSPGSPFTEDAIAPPRSVWQAQGTRHRRTHGPSRQSRR